MAGHDQLDQVAEVQAGRGRVEADVEGDRAGVEVFAQCGLVGRQAPPARAIAAHRARSVTRAHLSDRSDSASLTCPGSPQARPATRRGLHACARRSTLRAGGRGTRASEPPTAGVEAGWVRAEMIRSSRLSAGRCRGPGRSVPIAAPEVSRPPAAGRVGAPVTVYEDYQLLRLRLQPVMSVEAVGRHGFRRAGQRRIEARSGVAAMTRPVS